MTQRKSRRLKCRHCGKLVSRKSKNKYFCSVKCMKMAVLLHNAGHPDSPIVTEDLTLEEFRKKYPDVVGSEWQGDPPEGTLAFKLKYGEWWKKDLPQEPR